MPLGEDFYMKSLAKYVQSRDGDFIIGSSRRLTGVTRFEATAFRRLRIHIIKLSKGKEAFPYIPLR